MNEEMILHLSEITKCMLQDVVQDYTLNLKTLQLLFSSFLSEPVF